MAFSLVSDEELTRQKDVLVREEEEEESEIVRMTNDE